MSLKHLVVDKLQYLCQRERVRFTALQLEWPGILFRGLQPCLLPVHVLRAGRYNLSIYIKGLAMLPVQVPRFQDGPLRASMQRAGTGWLNKQLEL